MTSKQRVLVTTCSLALLGLAAPSAPAGQVSGWWGGTWNCTIDGRPAKMRWFPVDVGESSCSGNVCTSSSAVAWKGSFADNGARAVALTRARAGDKGGLYFNHADGNTWYLAKPVGNRSTGWTTWQGKRYPLSCAR